MKLDLRSKLWLTIIIAIIFGSIFNYWFTLFLYEHLYVEQTEGYLKAKGEKLVQAYYSGLGEGDFKERVRLANQISDAEILLTQDPLDLCSCLPMIDSGSSFLIEHEQRQQLLNGESVVIIGDHKKFNRDVIAVIVPILNKDKDKNELIGGLLLYKPLATITEAVAEIRFLLIIYILVFLAVGIIVGKLISNTMTKPLREMETVAQKMMDGDFDAKVNIITKDEIGHLGETLNHLSVSLQKSIGLLSKEKKQLSQILDGIHDSVITINKDNEFVLCNGPSKHLLRKLGLNKDEFINLLEIREFINEVKNEKNVLTTEIIIKNKTFIIYFAPLIEDNDFWGIVLVFHDVTLERKKENEAREFLAIVSHELRTPLSYVRGYTEALLDGVAESRITQDKYLNTIHNETGRMERLVNDLLDLAQLERSTYSIKKEKIKLGHIVKQVVERYRPIYVKKGVQLKDKTDPSLWIIGDEDRIIQIMVNLLDNALRYTPSEGEVTVEIYSTDEDIVLKVIDTGEGIKDEDLTNIGKMFFRADKARSRQSGGTGLGLAIVKQIVEKLQGRLEVQSEVGNGTTFTIYLPNQIKE